MSCEMSKSDGGSCDSKDESEKSRGKKGTKLKKMKENMGKHWKEIKTLFRSSNFGAIELQTMTIPRSAPITSADVNICDDCLQYLRQEYGRRNIIRQRMVFRSIQIGNESPIILRELLPCKRCTPPEEMKYHKFEATGSEITKVKKKMTTLPKDVDLLQEFGRIEVEKTHGQCVIRSNRHKIENLHCG